MKPRLGVITCLACGLLHGAPLRSAPALATNPALTFFSSVSEEPFARLEAASIGPRYTRHGPFRVPAPGVEIEAPTLTLHDQPCAPADWARLLKDLAAWHRLPGSADLLLILPDARVFVFLQPPSLGEKHLAGLVRPLAVATATGAPAATGESGRSQLLRIAHDGDARLRIDLRPFSPRRVPGTAAIEFVDASDRPEAVSLEHPAPAPAALPASVPESTAP